MLRPGPTNVQLLVIAWCGGVLHECSILALAQYRGWSTAGSFPLQRGPSVERRSSPRRSPGLPTVSGTDGAEPELHSQAVIVDAASWVEALRPAGLSILSLPTFTCGYVCGRCNSSVPPSSATGSSGRLWSASATPVGPFTHSRLRQWSWVVPRGLLLYETPSRRVRGDRQLLALGLVVDQADNVPCGCCSADGARR